MSTNRNKSKYDRQSELYTAIRCALKERLEENNPSNPAVLNIHIPGTGGTKTDGYPTYIALQNLRDLHEVDANPSHLLLPKKKEMRAQNPIPHIYLEGVGSSGWDYIPPAMCDTSTLDDKKIQLKWYEKLFNVSWGSSVSDSERLGTVSPLVAQVGGFVSGTGKKANTQRIMNALQALEEDHALPKEIFLSGHSRGAVNCILLANEIYRQYGSKIQIHLNLTDPVPGNYKAKQALVPKDEYIIPPNVASFTCVYSQDDVPNILKPFFVANDLTRLVFTNPQTIITTYSVPGNHNTFFRGVNESAMNGIANGVNGRPIDSINVGYGEKSYQTSEMIGKTPTKAGQQFYKRTPIYSWCSKSLQAAIKAFRKSFETGYNPNEDVVKEVGPFYIPDGKNSEERKEIIKKLCAESKKEQAKFERLKKTNKSSWVSSHTIAEYNAVQEIKKDILSRAIAKKSYIFSDEYQKVTYKDVKNKTIICYLLPDDAKRFKIIESAAKKAGHNKLSRKWTKVLANPLFDRYHNLEKHKLKLTYHEEIHPIIHQLRAMQEMIDAHDFKLYGGGKYYNGYKISETAAFIMDRIQEFIDNHLNSNDVAIKNHFPVLKNEIASRLQTKIDDTANQVDNGLLLFNLGKVDKTTITLYEKLLTTIESQNEPQQKMRVDKF